jgi:hypothetical protein
LVLLLGVVGLACKSGIEPPPPPVSPPPPTNHPPVAVVGGPYTSDSGSVQFDGTQSSDPDGDALTFAWNFGDGATGSGSKPSHTYAQDGDYNVSLVVKDSKNASSTPATTTAAIARAPTLVGAGNIASGSNNDERTAALLDQIPGTVFTTGDNAFPDGTDSAYAKYYAATWGRHLSRTRPVLGNHDYYDSDAKGSFDFFGDRLGTTRGLGYYSYDLGSWHIIVLNDKGNASIDATQAEWLMADLAAHPSQCTIAMWHVALFISSNTPGWIVNPDHKPLWDVLYGAGVDIVLNGQQHNYERFAPMNPNGDLDPVNGIREFNVGTGGESTDNFTVAIHPHSEVRGTDFGVLKLTLKTGRYDWTFVPIAGASFSDAGSGSCH